MSICLALLHLPKLPRKECDIHSKATYSLTFCCWPLWRLTWLAGFSGRGRGHPFSTASFFLPNYAAHRLLSRADDERVLCQLANRPARCRLRRRCCFRCLPLFVRLSVEASEGHPVRALVGVLDGLSRSRFWPRWTEPRRPLIFRPRPRNAAAVDESAAGSIMRGLSWGSAGGATARLWRPGRSPSHFNGCEKEGASAAPCKVCEFPQGRRRRRRPLPPLFRGREGAAADEQRGRGGRVTSIRKQVFLRTERSNTRTVFACRQT